MGIKTRGHAKDVDLLALLNEKIRTLKSTGANQNEIEMMIKLRGEIIFAEADPNEIDTAPAFTPYKATHLMAHLVSENYAVVKSMISTHQDTINPNLKDIEGKTILCLAAKMNRTDIVAFLLKNLSKKIDINVKDNLGNTPLHYAYAYGNKEMVETFLRYGANPNVVNNDGLKPNNMLSLSEDTVTLSPAIVN